MGICTEGCIDSVTILKFVDLLASRSVPRPRIIFRVFSAARNDIAYSLLRTKYMHINTKFLGMMLNRIRVDRLIVLVRRPVFTAYIVNVAIMESAVRWLERIF